MTNISSGSKRPWDGSGEHQSAKRYHERERVDDAKDWKDVYLRLPKGGRDRDRKESGHRPHSRDYGRRKSGDFDRKRYPPRDRDRERDRDYYDRRRGDGYRRDGSRPRRDRRSMSPSSDRHRSPRLSYGSGPTNGHAHGSRHEDSEKEEGEISPHPSHGRTRSPTQSTRVPTPPLPKPKQPEPELELDLPTSPPPVEETLAVRRARRQAILAKYQSQTMASSTSDSSSAVQPPQPISTVDSNVPSQNTSVVGTPTVDGSFTATNGSSAKRETMSPSPTPGVFDLTKNDEQEDVQVQASAQNGDGPQISAADYDPSLDRREDEKKRVRGGVREEPSEEVEEEVEEEEEDVDDMFAFVSSEKKKVKKVKKVAKPAAPALITATLDSAADSEGYYQIILGEQLDGGRYQVFSSLGKGMFANVVRARVLQSETGEAGKEVAIKIVRCQETMYKAGLKEVQILNKLKQSDPEDKKHVVRLERTFEHRGHLCLVFESLSMNLRDVVKRFGKNVGLNIKAVRAYAHQLFLALSLLRKCNIMHADIKPDNILVNEQKTVLKLCDLGSASDASENEITPYLVSRFYRAPEIILGAPYDPAIDIWSIGCTLYELYTGKILFPGRSNNQMLYHMMELKGRFNSKMIKKAKFGDLYFDELGAFQKLEQDRVMSGDLVRSVHMSKPSRDLRTRLMPPASAKLKDDESKLLMSFVDLLDKCLALDPARRITPKEALAHAFIRGA